MGCAPSTDPKVAVAEPSRNNNNYNKSSRSNNNNNGFKRVELKNDTDNFNQINRPNSDKKPLAFVIEFDEKKKSGNINNRPPPGRLQLEPIGRNGGVTKSDIDEKMRAAERNRENILKSRVKSSKKRDSRNQSRNNSGSVGGSSYYNDSRKMSRDDRDFNFEDRTNNTNGQRQNNGFDNTSGEYVRMNGYNDRSNLNPVPKVRSEEEERKKERLLQRRRIVQNQMSDDEIEHNRKASDDEYF